MIKDIFPSAGRTRLRAAIRPGAVALSAPIYLAMLLASCDQREQPVAPPSVTPRFTPASGAVPTTIGRGFFANPVSVKLQNGAWDMSVDADPLDVALQTIVLQPGGHTGWHSHPGLAFVVVVEGHLTFYESGDPHCSPTLVNAGQGYIDTGEKVHIARNEAQVEAKLAVTYFVPPAAALRIDAPNPGNCPF